MTEEWKDIPGYEGRYQASTFGRVRSLDRTITTNHGVTKFHRGQMLNPTPDVNRGYLVVNMRNNAGKLRQRKVHQLILETFVGPCPPNCEVLHGPGGCQDNRLENLRWGTRAENVNDIMEAGLHQMASRTHCVNGHKLPPYTRGKRRCRPCDRASYKRVWQRKHGPCPRCGNPAQPRQRGYCGATCRFLSCVTLKGACLVWSGPSPSFTAGNVHYRPRQYLADVIGGYPPPCGAWRCISHNAVTGRGRQA